MEKPNVVLPLAISYNERGVDGNAEILAGVDQRKVNCFYEPIKNAITGETTLHLVKRPGVSVTSGTAGAGIGNANQQTYLIIRSRANALPTGIGDPWVISTSTVSASTITRVSATSPATTFSVVTSYTPKFIDQTAVNNIDTVVLQTIGSEGSPQRVFYASTITGWTEIVSSFSTINHVGKMEFMDGYAFQMDVSSRIFNSNINTISTWPVGNLITKQSKFDVAVGLARLGNQILAFGFETCEMFYNAGLTPAPLAPLKHLNAKIGMATFSAGALGSHYYAVDDNKMYFCGKRGTDISNGAYVYDGARFQKISTPAIDKILTEKVPQHVESFYFAGQQAISFRLDHVTTTPHRWLMFFPRWNDWLEWQSDVFKPVSDKNMFLGFGTSSNRLYQFANSQWIDNVTPYTQLVRFKIPTDGNHRKTMPYLGLVGDTEVSTTTSRFDVAISDDDWQTTTAVGSIDMTSKDKIITRLGAYKDRGIVLTHSGNTETRLRYVVAKVNE